MNNQKNFFSENIGIFFSLPKIILSLVYFVMMINGFSPISLSIIVVMIVVMDILDGRIASWLKINTPYCRLFDTACDKIITNFVFLATILHFHLPVLLYLPLFIRDSTLFCGGVFVARKRKTAVYPNLYHKIATFSIAVAGIGILLSMVSVTSITLLIISYTLYYISLVDHFGIMLTLAKKDRSYELIGYYPAFLEGIKALWAVRPFRTNNSNVYGVTRNDY